jgi:hypothetical protein
MHATHTHGTHTHTGLVSGLSGHMGISGVETTKSRYAAHTHTHIHTKTYKPYKHTYTPTYTHKHTLTHIHPHTHTQTHTNTHTPTNTHTHTQVCAAQGAEGEEGLGSIRRRFGMYQIDTLIHHILHIHTYTHTAYNAYYYDTYDI